MSKQNNKIMKLYTTIEIDETETELAVEFTAIFGEVEIQKITDVVTGDAICPDLLGEIDGMALDTLYNECYEFAANNEVIPVENAA